MKIKSRIKLTNESGVTLVETLISIVLLVLILTIFITVFTQSARMNQTSEEKIDATYLAQEEMEHLYALSLESSNPIESLQSAGYTVSSEDDAWIYFVGNQDDNEAEEASDYYIQIKLAKEHSDNLYQVGVEVYENADDSLQAKMQNVLLWGRDAP